MLFGQGIFRSLTVTLKNFLSRAVTVQYPHQRLPIPPRSRGAIEQKGAIDEEIPKVPVSEELPPCTAACPANVDARGYVGLIAQKRYRDAFALHLESNPLPATIGRICPHPCEFACRRGEEDQPITICYLKRFFADNVKPEDKMANFEKPKERKGSKVAIVGAGPAGLTATFYLGKCGYDVTIFDRLPVAGGLLSVAIPTYRLPPPVVEAEIKQILNLGAELKLKTVVGPGGLSIDDLFNQGYRAVFLAIGAPRPMKLRVEGENLKGVEPGETFLAKWRLGKKVEVPKRVAVIGGGNTAIDCARVSLRLGAKDVKILYRRGQAEMPAAVTETADGIEEGVDFELLTAPVKIVGKGGRVTGVECIKMQLGPPDESGRRRPIPVKGSEFLVQTDMVIPAIGRTPESEWLPEQGIEVSKRGTIVVDELSGATSREGVYAAGDVVTGPWIAVGAIGGARKAAYAIDVYLNQGKPSLYWSEQFPKKETTKSRYLGEDVHRVRTPQRDARERIKSFVEVEVTFQERVALQQAERCLSCMTQKCIGCYLCERVCPPNAISISTSQNKRRKIDKYQIDYGRCQFCGLCVETCPTSTLAHTSFFEMADYTRQLAIYDKRRLLKR